MVGEILDSIITEFDLSKFEYFFRQKSNTYTPDEEELSRYNNDLFSQVTKLGQMQCGTVEIAVISCKVERNLTERSSKKAQYILGKKILRFLDRYAGGFFIFYDSAGNFRFSFIYSIPQATGRREWSNFRRYTYYVSKDQTNKTFKQQMNVASFATVDDIIQAFSVEKVTKEFYQKIANWYFWAIKNVKFPSDAENEPNGHEMAVIRLITRIIFIWFMKVRHLIPEQLFDENFINQNLKNYNRNNNDFYKAILQNLFFATLNTKQEDRRFRNNVRGHKGFNPDFGNNSVYRYEDLFKDSKIFIEEYFYPIPFLNGGLFECLDIKLKDNVKYIDGFTDVAKHQPNVPNYLFFTDPDEELEVDLNKEYGTVNNKYTVEGLFNILKSYNFTIDENSFDDEEVALDPELLGKIFENLLASYNPETAKTARKETGSYYTPREIVDYMVEQSLRYYLKTEINDITDKELDELFTKENDESNNKELFDKNRTKQIIEAIYNLRVVDPAVGSGAFPMGMLHKLVLILHKLDPDNLLWKEMQIEAVRKNVKDPVLINKLVDQIEITFSKKNADYGRKLYLIQKCLYGVDIQPIAIEIAKLRFFISLLVDETIDKNENNYGIEPLPNLDFKLMQGNSLIENFYGIDIKMNLNTSELREEITPIIEKFDELKYNYQYQSDANKKKELLKLIEETLADLFYKYIEITCFDDLEFIKGSFIFKDDKSNEERVKQELDKYYKQKGFDIEKAISELKDYIEFKKPKNFFLWNVFFVEVFNEKGGFDIVIGNPPYVSTKGVAEKEKTLLERAFGFADDLYSHFYFKGIELLKDSGVLAFISSKTFWTIQTKKNLRELFLKNKILQIFDTANPFTSAMVDTCVAIVQKQKPNNDHSITFFDGRKDIVKPDCFTVLQNVYANAPNKVFFIPTDYNMKIYERLGKKVNELLDEWWEKISTSKNIEKNKHILEQYRKNLKPGDITLLGLITEGGQGLATANNGKYVGVLEGTKWAEKIRKERPEKLLLASEFCKKQNIKTKQDAKEFLEKLSENEIRKLFDDLKEKYSRDIFGQGWLYRIVSQDEIADVDSLTENEKLNGIKGKKTFVPYDKGDKDGNRWYAPTPYYIDWSRNNVKFLKENSGKKGEGMPVVRNPQFYFREGFCWNNVLSDEKIKCRLKEKSVHSTEAMTFISLIPEIASDRFLICLMNSTFFGNYRMDFINVSHHLTTGDAKEFPIIIPSTEQLKKFEDIFNRAYNIQKQKFECKINENYADEKLEEVQKELDEVVERMYMG